MPQPLQPLPTEVLTREEVANIEVGHTTVTSGTVRVLLAFFLALIVGLPIVDWAVERARGDESSTAWSRLGDLPGAIRAHLAGQAPPVNGAGVWQLIVSTNRIVLAALSETERTMEEASAIGRTLRRPAQIVMSGWLGAGNERVYRGRDGWLFYRPDVEHLTTRGFLDPAQIRRRVAASPEWTAPPQPDPREAIARFRNDLAARGITLVVMPTPPKPGVHPAMIARRYLGATKVLQNPSYRPFVEGLRRSGVLVFDPSEALAAARRTGPQYLATDTHWRPEAMEMVAELLGAFITANVPLPAATNPGYTLDRLEVRNAGDTSRMLLPDGTLLLPPEVVWLRRVLQPDGSPWRATRGADVCLLGDSFSNIYSLESMGWGTSAGFSEQLSYALRRPIDRIVQNDEGAFATRAMLQQSPDRLIGTRVVVYQFAARELSTGDWKVLPLPAGVRTTAKE